MTKHCWKNRVWTLAVIAMVVACAKPEDASSQSLEARIAKLDTDIRTAIGTASCTTDAQCAVIPIGQKACGGPAAYLAYSTQGTDLPALKRLATRHTDASKEFNKTSGRMSDCMVLAEPAAVCRAGRCVIGVP